MAEKGGILCTQQPEYCNPPNDMHIESHYHQRRANIGCLGREDDESRADKIEEER